MDGWVGAGRSQQNETRDDELPPEGKVMVQTLILIHETSITKKIQALRPSYINRRYDTNMCTPHTFRRKYYLHGRLVSYAKI